LNGLVFNIQRYSIHDGPGIRTVVFLKGCPLECLWCCNPESQSFKPELQFFAATCTHCGLCIQACPEDALNPDPWLKTGKKIDRSKCTACGECTQVCPSGSLKIYGQEMSVEAVVEEVLRDPSYYRRSGGGVTLSGGEPMGQPDFARQVLQACYEHNVHTAIETTGVVAWPLYEAILPYTDLFLYDMKHMDSQVHRQLTRVPNERIVDNARRLSAAGARIILRIPLIPGLNTQPENLERTADLAAELGVLEVHLMTFHQMGKDKYIRLERDYQLPEMPNFLQWNEGQEVIHRARQSMTARGLNVFIGG
jgi:pyruvate formate lyase activating enzyme